MKNKVYCQLFSLLKINNDMMYCVREDDKYLRSILDAEEKR